MRMYMASSTIFRRRKIKAGSTAIPFMITVLISLVVFGGIAMYFYQNMTAKARELKPMQGAMNNITEEDINSILFVLEPDDPTMETAVMMMHFDPVRKQEYCMGIPLDLVVEYEGRAMTVSACLFNQGANALKIALSSTLDQEIARYIVMGHDSFQTLIGMIGNVSLPIPIRDTGLRPTEASTEIDVNQFETLLTSTRYADPLERYSEIGLAVALLLNQCDGERIGTNLDMYFRDVIATFETDITSMDFADHKHAISYMFKYVHTNSAPARGIILETVKTEDGLYTVREGFLEDLKVTFAQKLDTMDGKKNSDAS